MTILNQQFLVDYAKAYGPVSKALSRLIRPVFIASPNRSLVWGDWSAIEARTLPYLAGSSSAEVVLDVFRKSDLSPDEPDLYLIEAGHIFNVDPFEIMERRESKDLDIAKEADHWRQTGKVAVLSLGFGGSVGALKAMAINYGIYLSDEDALKIVMTWRSANGWAKRFWDELTEAVKECRGSPGTFRTVGRLTYMFDDGYMGGTLFCAMPCGRLLSYPGLRMEKFTDIDPDTKAESVEWKLTYSSGYKRKKMWHGILAENPTQGFAASLLRQAKRTVDDLTDDYLIGHTHDEIVTDVPEDDVEEWAGDLRTIMETNQPWNEGLPLVAEISSGWYYSKAVYRKHK
jgi:DNA polymerase